jgi:hypothetical protein
MRHPTTPRARCSLPQQTALIHALSTITKSTHSVCQHCRLTRYKAIRPPVLLISEKSLSRSCIDPRRDVSSACVRLIGHISESYLIAGVCVSWASKTTRCLDISRTTNCLAYGPGLRWKDEVRRPWESSAEAAGAPYH